MRRSLVLLALVLGVAACGDDAGGDEEAVATTTTTSTPTTTTTMAAPAPDEVTVTVDGAPIDIVLACSGFDGAVVTEDGTGRRVMLVREGGAAIRVGSLADGFDETADVEITTSPQGELASGIVASHDIELFVPAGADPPPCPEGSSSG